MGNDFSNYPENFNIKGLDELKDFCGTRAQLYALISKHNPLAIIDKREAHVFIDKASYLMIMEKAQGGMRLRLIWKLGPDGGQYYIQDNTFIDPKPIIITK